MVELSKKDIYWLEMASLGGHMYPGCYEDEFPQKRYQKLRQLGYVTVFFPPNGAHKNRVVITERGRAALGEAKA